MSKTEIDHKYHELINECDLLIKAGKISHVANLISELTISQIPRRARPGLAKCCRRIGMIGSGLRILHPAIRGTKILTEPASATEICEYAALLSRNGSVHEALELLKNVDSTLAPEAFLYQGQCHILTWEYAEAIDCFKSFLHSTSDDYSKLIARVNLISGYIVLSKLNEAVAILVETIELAKQSKATRLLANCYELWGQVYFWQNDFSSARGMLNLASEIFSSAQSFDQLLILKTQSIMQSIEENSVKPLTDFRSLAVERKNWESVREADLFILKISADQRNLDHLIFGTPKMAYRRRIEMLVGVLPNQSYVLGSEQGPQLDIQTGIVVDANSLPVGKKVHQVLSTLIKDFYAPINIGTLFYELYPDEYFDIDSSPFRVRQAILRTRQWLDKNKIPASIQQSEGAYKFLITGEFGIKIQLNPPTVNPTMVRWLQLKEKLSPGISVTSEQICEHMGWSRTTFRRLADWACENNELKRFGIGKATTYQMTPENLLAQQKKAS